MADPWLTINLIVAGIVTGSLLYIIIAGTAGLEASHGQEEQKNPAQGNAQAEPERPASGIGNRPLGGGTVQPESTPIKAGLRARPPAERKPVSVRDSDRRHIRAR